MPTKKTAASAAKPVIAESASLVGLSKVELIALGGQGGQSAIDAGLEMLRRATKRQASKQQA